MSRAEFTNKDMHECLQRSETHVRGFAWSLVNKKRWKEWHPRIPERSPIFSFFPGLTAANDNQVFACRLSQKARNSLYCDASTNQYRSNASSLELDKEWWHLHHRHCEIAAFIITVHSIDNLYVWHIIAARSASPCFCLTLLVSK